jgi:hypothetical protein
LVQKTAKMPTIPEGEKLYTLFELRRRLGSGSPSYQSLRRWSDEGVKNKQNGKRIVLETMQVGSIFKTSLEAYRRFLERTNDD